MITATVYHQTNRRFMFEEISKSEVAMADYRRVAHVSISDCMTKDEALDYIYDVTNSRDVGWYATGNVDVESLVGCVRSTSCGDIIMLEGKKYMVASVGFKAI